MIDIIYKTVKPSHLEKLKIIQNIDNLTLNQLPNVNLSHLHIFWLSFDKAVYGFLHPFLLLKETDFQNILAEVLSREVGHE